MSTLIENLAKLRGMEENIRALEERGRDLDKWSFARMVQSVQEMFDRFAPWKVGDVAEIHGLKEPDPASGWYGYRDQLVDGRLGTIVAVDFWDGRFVATWSPLGQTRAVWEHSLPTGYDSECACGAVHSKRWVCATFEGPEMRVPDENPGCFNLGEKYLTAVVSAELDARDKVGARREA